METTELPRPDAEESTSSSSLPSAPAPDASRPGLPPKRLFALAIVASMLAGLAAWLIGEGTLTVFEPPPNMIRAMGLLLNRPSFEARTAAELKNVSLASGIHGACLGLALGIVAGLTRGSLRGGIVAGLSGLVLGFSAAAGASAALLPSYYHQLDRAPEALSHDLVLPFLIHAGTWAVVGAMGGIAFALGLREKGKFAAIVVGGVLGGILGTVVYEVVGSLFFSDARTTEPLASNWAPRLVGKLAVCVLAALGATQAAVATPGPNRAKSGSA